MIKEPSWANAGWLVSDVASLLLPGNISLAAKAGKAAKNAAKKAFAPKKIGKTDTISSGGKKIQSKTGGKQNPGQKTNSNKGNAKPDYYVSPNGSAIPAKKNEFNNNLSKMKDESNNKWTGTDSIGPIRVQVHKAHPDRPDFTGPRNPDHIVDHITLERRKYGSTGAWGKGLNDSGFRNKITIPQSMLRLK